MPRGVSASPTDPNQTLPTTSIGGYYTLRLLWSLACLHSLLTLFSISCLTENKINTRIQPIKGFFCLILSFSINFHHVHCAFTSLLSYPPLALTAVSRLITPPLTTTAPAVTPHATVGTGTHSPLFYYRPETHVSLVAPASPANANVSYSQCCIRIPHVTMKSCPFIMIEATCGDVSEHLQEPPCSRPT